MSLMQLLTTGKTLVDLKNSTSRYHMPGKNYLPKFGSAKNPFTPPVKKVVQQGGVETMAKPLVRAAPIPVASLKETQRLPALSAKLKETKRLPFVATRHGVPSQTPSPKRWEIFLDWAGVMLEKLNPAGWRIGNQAPAKPAVPRFDKPVVQGELSLQNLKVVRNDLNDADMEVLPARTFSQGTNFKPALQAQMKTELAVSHGSAA